MLTQPFYIFTALHSFLIGLFPFYIPVYLLSTGVSLGGICLFVAATGAGYCVFLYFLDRLREKIALPWLITWSFVSEYFLLIMLLQADHLFLPLIGLANGIFSCSFWTIQRLLFVSSVNPQNSGRNFGNTQIMVLLVLKTAILLGGFLLEQKREALLLLCAGTVVVAAVILFLSRPLPAQVQRKVASAAPLPMKSILQFKDGYHSRPVFVVDGMFLYLESYFWLISLFILVRESFRSLGLLTVVLALFFAVVFLIIKNTIDGYSTNRLYFLSVFLYALSWLLRALFGQIDNTFLMMLVLAVIAFCTSLFRLSFNKRFFDNAQGTVACHYILIKSYISQFCLAIAGVILALLVWQQVSFQQQLTIFYIGAACLTPVFLLYRAGRSSVRRQGQILRIRTSTGKSMKMDA